MCMSAIPPQLPHQTDVPSSTETPEQLRDDCPRPHERTRPRQLRCNFDGCIHEGTFPRKWELARHVQAKHSDVPGVFVCRAEDCHNKGLPWTFTRSDKLTAHIKACHTRDTIFTTCPGKRCSLRRSTLETLGVHIERAHTHDRGTRAVLNATPRKARKCPLWRCGKHIKPCKLLDHAATHTKEEILAAASSLGTEGLAVVSVSGSVQSDHAPSGFAIVVRCPICSAISSDSDAFVDHLWTDHIFLAGSDGPKHLVAWKSIVVKELIPLMTINFLPWAGPLKFVFPNKIDEIECPSCLRSFIGPSNSEAKSRDTAKKAISTHHLSLLRPEAEVIAELYPHRMQILRLYPEFASHPVFADFDRLGKDYPFALARA